MMPFRSFVFLILLASLCGCASQPPTAGADDRYKLQPYSQGGMPGEDE